MVGLTTTIRMNNCSACPAVWPLRLPLPLNSTAGPFSRLQWQLSPSIILAVLAHGNMLASASLPQHAPSLPHLALISWFAALLKHSKHFQISFFFLVMFIAGPPCGWAKGGMQDKSGTLFTHLHFYKKQVWGSYAPKLGTTFLLFDFFFKWLLCDQQLLCDFIFCFGLIS